MSEIDWGIWGLLRYASIYSTFHRTIGIPIQRRTFVNEYVRPWAGAKILDVGCGPADILEELSHWSVEYLGIDHNDSYIRNAKKRWDTQRKFRFETVGVDNIEKSVEPQSFDIVITVGVLHHLEDEQVTKLATLAKNALVKGGRLVTLDPCHLPDGNPLERLMIRLDRGQNVRDLDGYRRLLAPHFSSISQEVRALARLPLRGVIFQCEKGS